MKKLLLIIFVMIFSISVYAKQSQSVISDEQIIKMKVTIDNITKKMYSKTFLSPQDTSALIGIKILLDDAMLQQPDVKYALIYYKLGKIYQQRGKEQEAIECFQTIIENFAEITLAQKSAYNLKQMGVNIVIPIKQIEEE